jgi:hypothetical protein
LGSPYEGGGGLYLQSTDAVIENSVISGNATLARGGAFYLSPDSLGRLTHFVLANSSVISNTAGEGGGFYISVGTLAHLDKVYVQRNVAANTGGGFHLYQGTLTATNTMVGLNQSSQEGGAIFSDIATLNLIHDTIASNKSSVGKDGIFCRNGGSAYLANLIVWNSGDDLANLNSGSCTSPIFSIVKDGDNGSITANPRFVDIVGGDFHIADGSPAIDAAKPLGVLDDIDGQLRDASPDIGADEALADLSIVKLGWMQSPLVTYTLVFSNVGSLEATGVNVVDSLPAGLTNLNVISSGVAITQTGAAPNFVWKVQNLKFGQTGMITITGRYAGSERFTNTATISGDKTEATLANNVSSVTLPLIFTYLPFVLRQ